MREDLRVGLAGEAVAAGLELRAELGEVLDDAVVDHRDAAVAAGVGMRVGRRGAAVRRPARVADAAGAGVVAVRELGLEARDLAHPAHDVQAGRPAPGPRRALERHARRVVAAVLEPLEPGDEDVLRCIRSGVSDDSAHERILPADRPRTVRALTPTGDAFPPDPARPDRTGPMWLPIVRKEGVSFGLNWYSISDTT